MASVSIQRVETRFGVSRTIVYVLRNKYHVTGLVKGRPRLIRQRVTKRAQDRYNSHCTFAQFSRIG